jgi:hypothetical protein
MTEQHDSDNRRHHDAPHSPRRWTDAELDELLGVHALDAIDDPDERAAVEDYVMRSPRARAELDSHRHVASAIGNSVIAAPHELWTRIADRLGDATTAMPGSVAVPDSGAVSTPAPLRSPRSKSRFGRRRVRSSMPSLGGGIRIAGHAGATATRPWAIASAAAVVVAVASTGIALNRNAALRSATSKNQVLRSDVAIERARSSQLLGQIDTLRNTSPVALRLAQLESDPSARNVQLVSATGRTLGHVLLAADGEGYVIGDTLPTLPIGRTYQLWGVKDGLVLSLGVMGRAPKAMPFAADERWSQLVLTDEASPGVVASKASAAAVATLDQA